MISVIIPCYNAGLYLEKSIRSLIAQTCKNWEAIIVNDGSTDNSESIANQLAAEDQRIKVISKENGGYVSARLAGYKFIATESKYLLFYDADDMLHPEMLQSLYQEMEVNSVVGAAYCDHRIMDEQDNISETGIDMARLVPTTFWVKRLEDFIKETPFISIFCWTKMIEPMTLIRREAYDQTPGWDMDFGRGQGNIGEGVYLFSEIALKWKVHFVNKPLYYYRRHSQQMSAIDSTKMQEQTRKVINKWNDRIQNGFLQKDKVRLAIHFFIYRRSAYKRVGSLKHWIRHKPLSSIGLIFNTMAEYIVSLTRALSYKQLLK